MIINKLAELFPQIEGKEFEDLASSIKESGLLEAIWLNKDGEILDGRNRYNACLSVGVRPEFQTYEGDNPLQFVLDKNLKRRHLNESQRAAVADKMANMAQGERTDIQPSDNLPKVSQLKAAELLNVSDRTIRSFREAKEKCSPEVVASIEAGNTTIHAALKGQKAIVREEARWIIKQKAEAIPISKRWFVEEGNIETYKTEKQFDFIITDPPYLKEYLPLYGTLAQRANDWLKPGGMLVVMCGQSYLNEIYAVMSEHLEYYWTACYLTPGQPTPLRQRNVNTTWKPLLCFIRKGDEYKGKIFGDVFKSDGNDKSLHEWGQSESGMISIIAQMCFSGQSIFDPFCGAGTTGIAALHFGCLFHGIDNDIERVKLSKGRLSDH